MNARFTRTFAAGFALALMTACGSVDVGGGDVVYGDSPGARLSPAGVTADKRFAWAEPAGDRHRLRIDAVNGTVEVSGAVGSETIVVDARLVVGSQSEPDVRQGLEELDVLVTADGPDEVHVRTLQPSGSTGRQYLVNYTITVPVDLGVHLTQVNGDVRVEGIASSVFVDVVNGDVDATVRPPPTRDVHLSTVNGDVGLRVPAATSAEVEAFSGTGTVAWAGLPWTSVTHTNRSLTGTLGDGSGSIRLTTSNGRIAVIGTE